MILKGKAVMLVLGLGP